MNELTEHRKPTMSSREIAEVVESRHDKVKQSMERLADRGLIAFTPVGEKDTGGRPGVVYHVNKRDSYVVVAQLSPEFTARLVDRWQELEESAAKTALTQSNVPATLALVECAANLLRASDSGKVVMLRKAGQAIGADTSFLPDYTEDSAPGHVGAMDTASLTQLLHDYGVGMSAARFNQVLAEIGLLERRSRRTSGGETKSFWCITDAGQKYGKNVVSPQSPRETQPHWYRKRFTDLLALAGMEGAA
ncbi:Rha family transcriptional regulator [Litchfieldella xinjiangensis]|uniref:Rha family transcriptional regulator n=1 Tax=Litchfieldella xinjiangensis TaxID=1166948 RepID=UPI0009E0871B|nr:Rha family transcriptional regulator [Halomonas xinjiangensis]